MRASAACLAAAAAALAGCGGDEDDDGREGAKPVGKAVAGSVVQFADCRDWRKGTVEERHATVDALRGQLTATRSESAESPLSDERAYEILEKVCAEDYAGHLRLSKLYVRAQGFAPLTR